MKRIDLERYLNQYLRPEQFRDYCPNGLQIEGVDTVNHVVTGVTASLALIEAAIANGADTLLVHHGFFWRGDDVRIIGMRRARIAQLINHNLNLFAYHLPLDAHVEVGNNQILAQQLGLEVAGSFGDQQIACHGQLAEQHTLQTWSQLIAQVLQREPQIVGDLNRSIRRVAWCTGAAQSFFEEAIALGVDVFLSGEISEQAVHLSRESGVAYIAAGHHATERFGIQALGIHLEKYFDVRHQFIDIDNPF